MKTKTINLPWQVPPGKMTSASGKMMSTSGENDEHLWGNDEMMSSSGEK